MLPSSRALRWLARLAVSAGIVAYILVDVDLHDLARAVRGVRLLPLAAAAVLFLGGQGLSAWKWALLGRSLGFARSLADYTRFYFVGMFFNLFAPSTIGGDLVRAIYLGEGRRPGLAIDCVVFDRASGLAMLTALGAAALVLFPGYDFPRPVVGTVVGGGVALVLGWWMCPRLVRLLPRGYRVTDRIRQRIEIDLAPFWRDRALLGRVAALSLVFHLTQVTVAYVLAAVVGAAVPFSYCLVFHPMIATLSALPLSVSGLGVREGGYLYFLTRIGVDASVAVTVGLVWSALTLLGGLVGGAVFLASGATLPNLKLRAAQTRDAAA